MEITADFFSGNNASKTTVEHPSYWIPYLVKISFKNEDKDLRRNTKTTINVIESPSGRKKISDGNKDLHNGIKSTKNGNKMGKHIFLIF